MNDHLSTVPTAVSRLATACLLEAITWEAFRNLPIEQRITFAELAGVTAEEYVDAVEWLGNYYVKHAEQIRAIVELRRTRN
jgi:hypothetical protein